MNYRDGQKQQVLSENSSLFYVVFTWWWSCSNSLIVTGWVSCLHTNICETQRCASFQLHYLILLVFTTMKNTTHNMAPVLSVWLFSRYMLLIITEPGIQTNTSEFNSDLFACAKVLVSWAFIQRDSVERYRKCGRKKRGRPAAKDLRLVCRRGLCTLNLFSTCLSVSRNYWTDFHLTWMEDESQCTLDHVIFCCGGISSHFLKRWQIMCGSGWEQFHSAPTMKIDGNSCWEGWNTVVSVWVGLKVRLLD